MILHDPVPITAIIGGWRRREVGAEAELADEGIEEAAPLGVVRFDEIGSTGTCALMFTICKTAADSAAMGGTSKDASKSTEDSEEWEAASDWLNSKRGLC